MLTAPRCSVDVLVATLVLALAGCGGSGLPDVVRVKGRVTLDGEPVEGAEVVFVGTGDDNHPARGTTDADGEFVLSTYVDPRNNPTGIVPGTYRVTVTRVRPLYPDLPEEERNARIAADMEQGKPTTGENDLPNRYANPDTSGFEFEIEESRDDIVLALEP